MQSVTLIGRARVCSVELSVEPRLLNFGDCNVGVYKTMNIAIRNLSDMTAIVLPHVESKALSIMNKEFSIPPLEVAHLKVEFVPRKINPHYQQRIQLINNRNPRFATTTIDVVACNMDTRHMIYHALFYKLITPTNKFKSQLLYFGKVIQNCPVLRTFRLVNSTDIMIKFVLTSSTSDVSIYLTKESHSKYVRRREKGHKRRSLRDQDEVPTISGQSARTVSPPEVPTVKRLLDGLEAAPGDGNGVGDGGGLVIAPPAKSMAMEKLEAFMEPLPFSKNLTLGKGTKLRKEELEKVISAFFVFFVFSHFCFLLFSSFRLLYIFIFSSYVSSSYIYT
jgi:hypothetical protein